MVYSSMIMATNWDGLLERLDRKLKEKDLSDRRASYLATGKYGLIQEMRRKRMPSGDRLNVLASILDTNVDWLMRGEGADAPAPPGASAAQVSALGDYYASPRRERDVPVLGTGECGDLGPGHDGQRIETLSLDLDEVVDYARRPVGLEGRKDVYAIYFTGHSMVPRYEPNEIGYVDPRKPPAIGDFVLVQLRTQDGEDERIVRALVKRLVRRTADYYELEQFNPATTFRIETKQVARIHRILTPNDLAGV